MKTTKEERNDYRGLVDEPDSRIGTALCFLKQKELKNLLDDADRCYVENFLARSPPMPDRIIDEDRVRSGNRKDRRRWCKGKVGREHQYEWKNYREIYMPHHPSSWPGSYYDVQVCGFCGQHGRLRKRVSNA